MNIEVTPLPGIGIRKDFVASSSGRRVGVVTRRDGGLDLIVSKAEDPDACLASLRLSVEEAATLSSLLGAPQVVSQLRDEHRDLPGVSTRQLSVEERSPFNGRPMGDTQMRTRTGASVVAVMRAGEVYPSPRPEFTIVASDVLIVVGTQEGIDAAVKILVRG